MSWSKKDFKYAEKLLVDAFARTIFVHRYKFTHDQRRRVARHMCKDGLLVMVDQNKDGWLYRAAQSK
jgi:hypothetical protein